MKKLILILATVLMLCAPAVALGYQPDGLPEWITANTPEPMLSYEEPPWGNLVTEPWKAIYGWAENTIYVRDGYDTPRILGHEYAHAVWAAMTNRGRRIWNNRLNLYGGDAHYWTTRPAEAFAETFVRRYLDSEAPYRSKLKEPPKAWLELVLWMHLVVDLED